MSTKIYHNPRCSKSRQTLELLHNKGIETDVIEYLNIPPDADTLEKILSGLGMQPRELMRKGQDEYKTLGLDNENLSHDDLIKAMIENPILIERPIVITDKGIAIGRPIENVQKILNDD
jgi:arsenate reductase (glutaredoxin)